MAMYPESTTRRIKLDYATDDRSVFNFFNTVYAWMAVGLALTAAVAWYVSRTPSLLNLIYGSGPIVMTAMALGAFAIAWGVQSAAHRISATAATALFLVYAAIIGMLISYVFRGLGSKRAA